MRPRAIYDAVRPTNRLSALVLLSLVAIGAVAIINAATSEVKRESCPANSESQNEAIWDVLARREAPPKSDGGPASGFCPSSRRDPPDVDFALRYFKTMTLVFQHAPLPLVGADAATSNVPDYGVLAMEFPELVYPVDKGLYVLVFRTTRYHKSRPGSFTTMGVWGTQVEWIKHWRIPPGRFFENDATLEHGNLKVVLKSLEDRDEVMTVPLVPQSAPLGTKHP